TAFEFGSAAALRNMFRRHVACPPNDVRALGGMSWVLEQFLAVVAHPASREKERIAIADGARSQVERSVRRTPITTSASRSHQVHVPPSDPRSPTVSRRLRTPGLSAGRERPLLSRLRA